MKLKASLHLHSKEDIIDRRIIGYDIYQLIDRAQALSKTLSFKVLAVTGHQKIIVEPEHQTYAWERGILLIKGVELALERKLLSCSHVLVLNCRNDVEKVKTLGQLADYKAAHPEIFIMAPHPLFSWHNSLGRAKLIKYIDLFDAIEYNWFYSRLLNLNRGAEKLARFYNKPVIASSDLHVLDYLDSDYLEIEAEKLAINNIFKALKSGNFRNITKAKSMLRLVCHYLYTHNIKKIICWK